MLIKIGTFNTQHCKDFAHYLKTGEELLNYKLMADTIQSLGIEICGMQEMRSQGKTDDYLDQTKIIADYLGYKYYYFGKAMDFEDGPYGNSIVSKYPIISAETILIPSTNIEEEGIYCYENRSIIKVKIDIPGGLTVFNCHMGLSKSDRERAVEYCLREIDKVNDCGRIIFMGDFNTEPDDEILKPVYEKLFDAAKLMNEFKYTFPSLDFVDGNNRKIKRKKIDYIFTNDRSIMTKADTPDVVAADHRLHTVVLKI